jgi:hypothetical protein
MAIKRIAWASRFETVSRARAVARDLCSRIQEVRQFASLCRIKASRLPYVRTETDLKNASLATPTVSTYRQTLAVYIAAMRCAAEDRRGAVPDCFSRPQAWAPVSIRLLRLRGRIRCMMPTVTR